MARWLNTPQRRVGVGMAGVFLAAVVAGCAPTVSSAPPPADEIVIVCESGTVTKDGIKTSSAVATKVPAGTPIPAGCRLG